MPLKECSLWSLTIILIASGAFLGIVCYLGETYIRFDAYQEYTLTAIEIAIFLIIYG